jgi:hypothetical protein
MSKVWQAFTNFAVKVFGKHGTPIAVTLAVVLLLVVIGGVVVLAVTLPASSATTSAADTSTSVISTGETPTVDTSTPDTSSSGDTPTAVINVSSGDFIYLSNGTQYASVNTGPPLQLKTSATPAQFQIYAEDTEDGVPLTTSNYFKLKDVSTGTYLVASGSGSCTYAWAPSLYTKFSFHKTLSFSTETPSNIVYGDSFILSSSGGACGEGYAIYPTSTSDSSLSFTSDTTKSVYWTIIQA